MIWYSLDVLFGLMTLLWLWYHQNFISNCTLFFLFEILTYWETVAILGMETFLFGLMTSLWLWCHENFIPNTLFFLKIHDSSGNSGSTVFPVAVVEMGTARFLQLLTQMDSECLAGGGAVLADLLCLQWHTLSPCWSACPQCQWIILADMGILLEHMSGTCWGWFE